MHSKTYLTAIAAVAAAVLAAPTASAAPGGPYTEKVTVAPDGTEGDASSGDQSLSANGRYVAFVSHAENLVAHDTDGAADAFVRDLRTGTTRLASTVGESGVGSLSLSGNGRYLAYTADDHIWIKDLRTGDVRRADDAVDPEAGYTTAGQPALSADGRYLAFSAFHTGWEGPAGDRSTRIYRLDLRTGERVRVSQVPGEGAWKSAATRPTISADGGRVGYQFFVPYPTSGDWSDAYVRDVRTGELIQADKAPDGKVSDAQTEFPQVSADGRYMVFNSLDSQLTPDDTNKGHNVFVRDLETGQVRRIDAADPAGYTAYPQLSADSRHLVYVADADAGHTRQAYVRDLRTGRTVLASPAVDGGPSGNYGVDFPVIDRHGRTVAFSSWANDLVPEDAGQTDFTTHVYVRHLK
ncbi:hypothetical protein ABZ896_05530 [Streptomyces sp. NPDC047072]|uniref:TolB family protein n=1 Tax=Streptomyces sp. NPDC047072 TaxID=3154809 RepID=UPI0033E47A18